MIKFKVVSKVVKLHIFVCLFSVLFPFSSGLRTGCEIIIDYSQALLVKMLKKKRTLGLFELEMLVSVQIFFPTEKQ